MFNKILIANRGAEQSLAIAFVNDASRAARSGHWPVPAAR
jgi:hypothetical protein